MLVGEYSVEVLKHALKQQNVTYDHDVSVFGKLMSIPESNISTIIFRLSETRMIVVAPVDYHLGDSELKTPSNDWQDYPVAKFPLMTTSPDPITGNTVVLGMMAFKSGEEANSFFQNTKYLGELPVRATYEALQECNDEDNVILWQEETPNPRHRLHWMRLSDLKLPARSGVTAAEEILRRQNAAKNGMS